jgi:hypothetical protein
MIRKFSQPAPEKGMFFVYHEETHIPLIRDRHFIQTVVEPGTYHASLYAWFQGHPEHGGHSTQGYTPHANPFCIDSGISKDGIKQMLQTRLNSIPGSVVSTSLHRRSI